MKKIMLCCLIAACIAPVQAQLLKKLKAKVDQSAKDVKTKVKEKAETAPDRVIDHAATKVDTKAETKIDNKENKVNSKVDKTVDKVDSIKIKKTKEQKDTLSGSTYRNGLQQKIIEIKNRTTLYPMKMNNWISSFSNKQKQLIIYSHYQI